MDNKNTTKQNTIPATSTDESNKDVSTTIANAAKAVTSEDNSSSLFRDKASDVAGNATTSAISADIFSDFAEKIIKEQEGIIGPIAYEQAAKVAGLSIDASTHAVKLTGDKKQILENLVKQYELLFGRVSIEICKEAVRGVISSAPADQVPQILL